MILDKCSEFGVDDLDSHKPIEIINVPDNFTGYIDIVNDEKIHQRYTFEQNKLISVSFFDDLDE